MLILILCQYRVFTNRPNVASSHVRLPLVTQISFCTIICSSTTTSIRCNPSKTLLILEVSLLILIVIGPVLAYSILKTFSIIQKRATKALHVNVVSVLLRGWLKSCHLGRSQGLESLKFDQPSINERKLPLSVWSEVTSVWSK